jgi:hypothetical protein
MRVMNSALHPRQDAPDPLLDHHRVPVLLITDIVLNTRQTGIMMQKYRQGPLSKVPKDEPGSLFRRVHLGPWNTRIWIISRGPHVHVNIRVRKVYELECAGTEIGVKNHH